MPTVKEMRRLAAAYAVWPGPSSARPTEVLQWHNEQVSSEIQREIERTEGTAHAGTGLRPPAARYWVVQRSRERPERSACLTRRVLRLPSGEPRRWLSSALAWPACRPPTDCVRVASMQSCTTRRNGWAEDAGRSPISSRMVKPQSTAVEYVDSRHTQLRALAAELGVDLIDTYKQDIPSGSTSYRWVNGALRDSDEVYANFGEFYTKLKRAYRRVGDYHWDVASQRAKNFDNLTIIEYLTRLLTAAPTRYWDAESKSVSRVSSAWNRARCQRSTCSRHTSRLTQEPMSASVFPAATINSSRRWLEPSLPTPSPGGPNSVRTTPLRRTRRLAVHELWRRGSG